MVTLLWPPLPVVSTLLYSLMLNCQQMSSLFHLYAQPFHFSVPLPILVTLNCMHLIKCCVLRAILPDSQIEIILCFYLAPAFMCLVRALCWFLWTSWSIPFSNLNALICLLPLLLPLSERKRGLLYYLRPVSIWALGPFPALSSTQPSLLSPTFSTAPSLLPPFLSSIIEAQVFPIWESKPSTCLHISLCPSFFFTAKLLEKCVYTGHLHLSTSYEFGNPLQSASCSHHCMENGF